jgi:hypothetical protein
MGEKHHQQESNTAELFSVWLLGAQHAKVLRQNVQRHNARRDKTFRDITSEHITAGDITSVGHKVRRDETSGRTKRPDSPPTTAGTEKSFQQIQKLLALNG